MHLPIQKRGLLIIAYKLLVNDRSKFFALLVGVTFAVFLMIEMTSMFAGVLKRSSATVENIGAEIWVMDPAVQNVSSAIPMPDYLLDAARSIEGVAYAVPVFTGSGLAHLKDGTFQAVSIIGLDDASLYGRPDLESGNILDVYGEDAFIIVKDNEYAKLESPVIGTEFEINDHRGVIMGVAKVASGGLFGIPTLYTTFNRALQVLPQTRFTISYILIKPKSPQDVLRIKQEIKNLGYLALTREEFDQRISDFYKYQTGFGINLLLMTVISFVVGLSISGQTFYTFILENLEKFGALKAIGAKSGELVMMILFQAFFVCLTGYGLGVGICSLLIMLAKLRLPDYAAIITFSNLAFAFVMVLIIAGISSAVAVRRVLRIEPFDIFRG
jgi:putative ABC transport system permease protein